MSRTVLFVYGTLKTGHANNKLLAKQEFLGRAATLPLYRLYGLGWHPGLVTDTDHGLSIEGELWGVDGRTLAELDEYEGVPHWFDREPVALRDMVGDFQAYFFKQAVPADSPTGAVWPFPA